MSDFVRPDIPVLADPPLGRPRLKRLRLAFILFGLSLLALVSTAFGMMMAVASDLPQLENQTEFKPSQNSVLVDVRGQYLATLADQGRIIVPAKDIALNMQHAIIAIEDERFYENDGVDLRGIGRALVHRPHERAAPPRAARRSRSSSSRTRPRRRTSARCSRRSARRRSPTTSRASGPSARSSPST